MADGTALIAGAFALLAAAISVVLLVETWLLATGRKPITWHTRRLVHKFPAVAFGFGILLAAGAGWLAGHLGK